MGVWSTHHNHHSHSTHHKAAQCECVEHPVAFVIVARACGGVVQGGRGQARQQRRRYTQRSLRACLGAAAWKQREGAQGGCFWCRASPSALRQRSMCRTKKEDVVHKGLS